MITALERRYRAEECTFRTIYGVLDGYKVYADRSVAEKIEKQTDYAVKLYNVDVRKDQQYMAEHDIFPCGYRDESRFSPNFEIPLTTMELHILGDPGFAREISCIEIQGKRMMRLEGPEQQVISDLMDLIKSHDPDILLFRTQIPGFPL